MLPEDQRIRFNTISDLDMKSRQEDYFWYVLDLDRGKEDRGEVVVNPFVDDMAERIFVFEEQKDAWKWKHILGKSPALANHQLAIQGDLYASLLKDVKDEEFDRFVLSPIDRSESQNLFANFPDELLDYVEPH